MMAQTEMSLSEDVRVLSEEWLRHDQNPTTRTEINQLMKSGNEAELRSRLENRMTFGTAGLRARMGAGYTHMNDLTIIQTTQGFSCYLEEKFGAEESHRRGVALGYDARHNSHRFAQLAATVLVNKKFKVCLFSSITPTPFTPYAVCLFKCVAGIMITASHNPKHDNGYKVYWDNGAQIIPPHDKGISAYITQNMTPWASSWDTSVLESSSLISDPLQAVKQGYYSSVEKHCCFRRDTNQSTVVKFTYTPMHGVGLPFVRQMFKTFRFPEFIPVKEQMDPDPEFPTVKFPNPEEGESALTLAMQTADAHGSPIILANDPDADRLAVAEKQSDGTWRVFNGNEIGSFLGWWAVHNYKRTHSEFDGSKLHMLASTVSSKLLRSMAKIEGFQFHETLTGFKWMGNKSHELMRAGHEVLFAYEEAIGFMFGTTVLDKDGISAAAAAAELCSWLYSEGRTLSSLLEEIYTKYGRFLSSNSYYLCYSKETISALFESLRKDSKYPEKCGSSRVLYVKDLTVGYDSSTPDNKPLLPVDPSSQLITFTTDQCVFTLRTSGTEPKIKYYVEVFSSPGALTSEQELRVTLDEIVQSVVKEFLRPEKWGLESRS